MIILVDSSLGFPSMSNQFRRVRPFLGSKDFGKSRDFYRELGFEEQVVSETMSVFHSGDVWFYLQRYYVKDWVNNTMIFLEVEELDQHHQAVTEMELTKKYPGVKLSSIQDNDWGREFFLHDPAGNLLHIGRFAD